MLKDLQQEKEIGYCDHCGGEVYPLDEVRHVGKSLLHTDCVEDWLNELFPVMTAEEILGGIK